MLKALQLLFTTLLVIAILLTPFDTLLTLVLRLDTLRPRISSFIAGINPLRNVKDNRVSTSEISGY